MKPFNVLKHYFNFNKRERNGILILLSILVLTTLCRIFINSSSTPLNIKVTYLDSLVNTIDTAELKPARKFPITSVKGDINPTDAVSSPSTFFLFDPNTISEVQAIKLGFPKKLAKTLTKYCSKGGKFRNKEDLKKLYGMSDKLYAQLEPYILIEGPAKSPKRTFEAFASKSERPVVRIIELNSADSLQLVSLNGIGPSFARKIMKFRNALGGFYSKEQLHEVYGMKDTLYRLFADRINVDITKLKKINPNASPYEEMKKHPYINHNIALSIVNYRSKHGPFKKADDLIEIGTLSAEALEKVKPYLEF